MGGGYGGSLSSGDIDILQNKVKKRLQDLDPATSRHVFISFSSEDLDEVNLLRGQAKSENTDLEFDDYSLKEAINSERAEYIKQVIREKIDKSSVTIVYLSENSADSEWVNWEINESINRNKGVIGIYSGDSVPSKLPPSFQENKCKIINWGHEALMSEIDDANRNR